MELDTNSKINREIAKAIVSAQICSDGGKDINTVATKNCFRGAHYMRYALKTTFILRAIKMIVHTKNEFSFFAKEEPDQNGYSSVLVYFEFRCNGTKHQISFHSPRNKAAELLPFCGKGRKTHWNCARTSRADAQLLAELFDL